MLRLFPVKDLSERKKLLLIQSELHRRTLVVQVDAAQQSLVHLRKRFALLGLSSVALSVGASIAGILFARKTAAAPGGGKGGVFSKIFSTVSVFNQIKSIFKHFKPSADETESGS